MRRTTVLLLLAVLVGTMLAFAGSVSAAPVETLEANLTGEKEVPGPGDRNGSGAAKLIVSRAKVCYVLRVENIARPNAAHIHKGGLRVAGPIVVELKAPRNGISSGCENIGRALARNLKRHPARYYVNVHNRPFPNGAIRGQLSE